MATFHSDFIHTLDADRGEMEYKEAEEAQRVDGLRVSGEQIYRP